MVAKKIDGFIPPGLLPMAAGPELAPQVTSGLIHELLVDFPTEPTIFGLSIFLLLSFGYCAIGTAP
ncbi:hypothetical protein ABID21_000462 [Pseudorhizobium tarimense]|uniref:Uncharacterized protein n=1 Tax=Pseudorhizobium tarimense TaxID=1079109 RepID=A0ABV2H1F4_9HYPH|nr:hypothetical protein [Pseudorhizobium tarimense]MCJ8517673.1 hypothetical protein [Pseudorhizobium tarimense]